MRRRLGGRDRQAARLALRAPPLAALAQDEVRGAQELVVGGFTDPQGARVGLGALLVGYFDGDDFVFAGKVGTGFDTKLLLDLRARLDALEIATPPFTKGDGPAAHARALGAAGDRRPGRVHRVDRARQAAPSAPARRPRRQARARGDG